MAKLFFDGWREEGDEQYFLLRERFLFGDVEP